MSNIEEHFLLATEEMKSIVRLLRSEKETITEFVIESTIKSAKAAKNRRKKNDKKNKKR